MASTLPLCRKQIRELLLDHLSIEMLLHLLEELFN